MSRRDSAFEPRRPKRVKYGGEREYLRPATRDSEISFDFSERIAAVDFSERIAAARRKARYYNVAIAIFAGVVGLGVLVLLIVLLTRSNGSEGPPPLPPFNQRERLPNSGPQTVCKVDGPSESVCVQYWQGKEGADSFTWTERTINVVKRSLNGATLFYDGPLGPINELQPGDRGRFVVLNSGTGGKTYSEVADAVIGALKDSYGYLVLVEALPTDDNSGVKVSVFDVFELTNAATNEEVGDLAFRYFASMTPENSCNTGCS